MADQSSQEHKEHIADQDPFILINFKTYPETSGANAVRVAKICDAVAKEKKMKIAIAVQATDLAAVVVAVSIPVFVQHIDPHLPGKSTGAITAEAITQAGAHGTLLNHSERQIPFAVIESSIIRAKSAGLITVVCANDQEIAKNLAALQPDFVAVEPPELIGTATSVSTARPGLIADSVAAVSSSTVPLLVGAGVHTNQDLRIALKLGAAGVLLSSGIAKSKDPEKALRDLIG